MTSICMCCSKIRVAADNKEEAIHELWTKLCSLQISITDIKTGRICLKCYLCLRLCYAYRESILRVIGRLQNLIKLRDTNVERRLNDVSIISHCPVCFILQPTTNHIYEHLSNLQYNEFGRQADNLHGQDTLLTDSVGLSKNCIKTRFVYACSGACGATFQCCKLLKIHEIHCVNVQKIEKLESTDTLEPAVISKPNSTNLVEYNHINVPQMPVSTNDTNTVGCKNASTTSKSTVSNVLKRNVRRRKCLTTLTTSVGKPLKIRAKRSAETVRTTKSGADQIYYKSQCFDCGKWVTNMTTHLRSHNSSALYECKFCHKAFKSSSGAQNHELYTCPLRDRKVSDKDKAYVCEFCGKSFSFRLGLLNHSRGHVIVPCSVCNKLIKKSSQTFHMKTVHSTKKVVCQYCGKLVNSDYHLVSHIYKCHRKKSYKCDKCDKMYSVKYHLMDHLKSHEVGELKHPCGTCGVTFFTPTSLSRHINTVHKKATSCTCNMCGKTLSSSKTLRIHERQHTGVKPYSCHLCGKTFTQKPPLNCHLRSQHNIVPSLVEKCPHCDQRFPSKMVLKTHMVKMH